MTRIMIVANQTLGCPELEAALEPYLETGRAEFRIVAFAPRRFVFAT